VSGVTVFFHPILPLVSGTFRADIEVGCSGMFRADIGSGSVLRHQIDHDINFAAEGSNSSRSPFVKGRR